MTSGRKDRSKRLWRSNPCKGPPPRGAITAFLSIAALLTLAGCGESNDAKGGPDRGTPQVGYRAGRDAIRAAQSGLRAGMSLAVSDDQAVGSTDMRDAKRREVYEPFFAATTGDDFVGVQNYERSRIDMNGPLPVPKGAILNQMGGEIYPQSLGNSVQYVHTETNLPILVTEHGVATKNDQIRSTFIVESMKGLIRAMESGVPVLDFMHWSLFDNFEWIFGYGPQLGLISVDSKTFVRTPKPSASMYSRLIAIASKLSRKGVI